MRMYSEAQSYEDWMNDMATNDSRPPRGWQAKYQTRCDCCGKFVQPGAPGGSWVMVPATDWNSGDERERCPACTEKHGQAHCGPGYVEHLCCGMNAVPNAWRRGDDENANIEMPHPRDLGTWIDSAIAVVEAHAECNPLARRVEKLEADRDALAAELKSLREQEPVLVQHRKPIGDMQGATVGHSEWKDGSGLKWWPHRHLYAHPVPARELTDETIQRHWDEACKDTPQTPGWSRHIRFARAIERHMKGEGK